MNQTHTFKCIYCPSNGPFSNEHVFPAGMGGDDKSFLLIDLVCVNCNTKIFSQLELSLMRRSPTAIGRKFMQSNSRDRGALTSKPTVETRNHYIIDESGRLLESEYDKNGADVILAQCLIEGEEIFYTAQDKDHLEKFYLSLHKALEHQSINLIKKINGESKSFDVTNYLWTNESYEISSRQNLQKPPKEGIWLELIATIQPAITPRFFQRLNGQLVLKTDINANHEGLLRSMRRTLPSMLDRVSEATTHITNQPIVQIEMPMDFYGSERALAKIGVNFLAHLFGADYIRLPDFDKIKSAIITGTPELPISSIPDEHKELISDLFGNVPEQCHCAMLMGLINDDGTLDVLFNAKLYGSGAHKITIAEKTNLPYPLEPIYFLINYESNAIQALSMMEYQLRHGNIAEDIINESIRNQNY